MATDLKNIARSYLKSWKERDFKTMRQLFADDVVLIGPLGECHSGDQSIELMQKLAGIVVDIVIKHIWVDGDNVISWYELHTTKQSKPMSIANWMHIKNGKLARISVTFDPRPLLDK